MDAEQPGLLVRLQLTLRRVHTWPLAARLTVTVGMAIGVGGVGHAVLLQPLAIEVAELEARFHQQSRAEPDPEAGARREGDDQRVPELAEWLKREVPDLAVSVTPLDRFDRGRSLELTARGQWQDLEKGIAAIATWPGGALFRGATVGRTDEKGRRLVLRVVVPEPHGARRDRGGWHDPEVRLGVEGGDLLQRRAAAGSSSTEDGKTADELRLVGTFGHGRGEAPQSELNALIAAPDDRLLTVMVGDRIGVNGWRIAAIGGDYVAIRRESGQEGEAAQWRRLSLEHTVPGSVGDGYEP